MSFSILRWLMDLALGFVLWDSLDACRSALDVLATLRDMSVLAQVGFLTCIVVIVNTMARMLRTGFALVRSGEFAKLSEDER